MQFIQNLKNSFSMYLCHCTNIGSFYFNPKSVFKNIHVEKLLFITILRTAIISALLFFSCILEIF